MMLSVIKVDKVLSNNSKTNSLEGYKELKPIKSIGFFCAIILVHDRSNYINASFSLVCFNRDQNGMHSFRLSDQ